jgi:hypothetical protein
LLGHDRKLRFAIAVARLRGIGQAGRDGVHPYAMGGKG